MTDRARIAIASIITALFLAAISTAGVLAHHRTPSAAPASAAPTGSAVQALPLPAAQIHYEHGDGEQHD